MGTGNNLFFRVYRRFKNYTIDVDFNYKLVPVIINNFNRLDCLKQQLNWLERVGIKNIFIIDNNSDYQPLLEFYKKSKHTVFLLDKNIGFEALWKTVIFQLFKNSYYIYTDPDILPTNSCPFDVVNFFYLLLRKFPAVDKVGFGIKIDDLPTYYPLKEKVIDWEQKFWQNPAGENAYFAPIDTTFALYRPGIKGGSELKAIRTGDPYLSRHTSWYQDPENLGEEDKNYLEKANNSASWAAEILGKNRNIKY